MGNPLEAVGYKCRSHSLAMQIFRIAGANHAKSPPLFLRSQRDLVCLLARSCETICLPPFYGEAHNDIPDFSALTAQSRTHTYTHTHIQQRWQVGAKGERIQ